MIDASILLYPIYGGVLMRSKRIPAEEQYRLIMECRQSGLTDHQWCVEHDIKPGTFYNWVKRLRQKGCVDLPASTGRSYRAPENLNTFSRMAIKECMAKNNHKHCKNTNNFNLNISLFFHALSSPFNYSIFELQLSHHYPL